MVARVSLYLLSFTASINLLACGEGHLYRARDQVQLQCFGSDGSFAYENRGTMTTDGQAALMQALANVDLEDSTVVDEMGWCNSADAAAATITLWIGDTSISYSPGCPTQGILELDEVSSTLLDDISDCTELDLLASVEPGCRPY